MNVLDSLSLYDTIRKTGKCQEENMKQFCRLLNTRVNLLTVVLTLFLLCSATAFSIEDDEIIMFYPTLASFDAQSNEWIVPVHGHVFEPEENSLLRSMLLKVIEANLDPLTPEASRILKRRLKAFLADNQSQKPISILLGNDTYSLGETEQNGRIETTLRISQKKMVEIRSLQGTSNQISFRTVPLMTKKQPVFIGFFRLVSENSCIVISDIDDTIKISDVRNRKELLRNTFTRPFKAVEGMAILYARFHRDGCQTVYVSASPWHLFTELSDFIKQGGFPDGVFVLKNFRVKDSDIFSLFKDPFEYKISALDQLIQKHPAGRFILIGDSGEKDPEAYGAIAAKYPKQITRILIRSAYPGEESGRYDKAFRGLNKSKWQVFTRPEDIK